MNKMNWKWTLACAAALVGATVLLDAQARAGKPAPPPPIRYQINYFTAPGDGHFGRVRAMNSSCVMVGNYHPATHTGYAYGFIYDQRANPTRAIDLNDLVQIPGEIPGAPVWYIDEGFSINDRGALLVSVQKILHHLTTDPEYQRRGLLIDTTVTPWTATWIPVVPPLWNPDETPKICIGRQINNNGDLLGGYSDGGTQHGAFLYNTGLYSASEPETPTVLPFTTSSYVVSSFNDPSLYRPLQVVGRLGDANGTPFRYTPEYADLETFPELSSPAITGINDSGEFCGRISVPTQKNVSKYVLRPFRFNPDLQVSPTLLGNELEHAGLIGEDINNTSDVMADGFGKMYLFHSTKGALNMDNLVIGTTEEVNTWLAQYFSSDPYLTERDATGFPWIGCRCSETLGCLLVPAR